MASNKAAAVTASAPLPQNHSLHDLLFQLKKDILRKRPVKSRDSSSSSSSNVDRSVEEDHARGEASATSTSSTARLYNLLFRDGQEAKPVKRRRVDDPESRPRGENHEKDYYRRMRDECCADEDRHQKFHDESIQKIREVRDVYLFGLQKVSLLQSLREAPDAILPGNFPTTNAFFGPPLVGGGAVASTTTTATKPQPPPTTR